MKVSDLRSPISDLQRDPPLKVVITHDWLVGGGAERVVQELHQLFPDAPIFTSYASQEWIDKLDGKVRTGYLQRLGKIRKYLPLLQWLWFRGLDLREYDLIISSAGNGMAKAVRRSVHTTHVSYCHTPVHYLWRHYDRYMEHPGFGIFSPLARLGLKLLAAPLRKFDYDAAQAVDHFIANSTHIQGDIRKYYKRESTVIHPPVDVHHFRDAGDRRSEIGDSDNIRTPKSQIRTSNEARRGFVTLGRLVPMKHVDIVVQACSELELPLVVAGDGPERKRLEKLAGPRVSFVGHVDNEAKIQALANAEAFLFASFEDFGITPVEAMAAGTPVIAYRAGGALDYIIEGKTGEFFDYQTVASLKKTLQNFSAKRYKPEVLQKAAEQFSDEHFRQSFAKYIDSLALRLAK